MDLLRSPGDDCNEALESNCLDPTGFSSAESILEPRTPTERLDIDTAMVEALRSALASDHGSSGPGWEGSEPYQLGDDTRSTDLGVLALGPPQLARRDDIDLAMLDALRQAMSPDHEVPRA